MKFITTKKTSIQYKMTSWQPEGEYPGQTEKKHNAKTRDTETSSEVFGKSTTQSLIELIHYLVKNEVVHAGNSWAGLKYLLPPMLHTGLSHGRCISRFYL